MSLWITGDLWGRAKLLGRFFETIWHVFWREISPETWPPSYLWYTGTSPELLALFTYRAHLPTCGANWWLSTLKHAHAEMSISNWSITVTMQKISPWDGENLSFLRTQWYVTWKITRFFVKKRIRMFEAHCKRDWWNSGLLAISC